MRILAAADLHGFHEVSRWLVAQAREFEVDALVLAGDIFGYPDEVEDPEEDQRIDAGRLERELLEAGKPVLFILGNDDLIEFEPASELFVSLHGQRVEQGGFQFVGYQYSLPWMGGPLEKAEEEIEADLAKLRDLLDDRTVLVTHSPAYGILDPGFGLKKIGSRSLRALVDTNRVLAHIHGHSHGGFGRNGIHFNVASAGRERAMLIDLASLKHHLIEG